MPERIYDGQLVCVEYVCDVCGKGTLEPFGGRTLLTDPPQYPHKCNHCGHEENLYAMYPTVRVATPEDLDAR